ncbi:MAG: VanZ family protein [Chitinophagales bacterium]
MRNLFSNLYKLKIVKIIPAIFWSGIIFFLCFLPGNALPKEDWLDKIYFDKIVHATLYFILFFLIIYGIKNYAIAFQKQIFIASIICVLQGILIEFVQGSSLIQNRSFDVFDIAANCIGVVFGIFFANKNHNQT